MFDKFKKIFVYFLVLIVAVGFYLAYNYLQPKELPKEFAQGNGRIETTQVDISAKLAGRLLDISVDEGDIVEKDQLLATLDTKELDAKFQEALAYVEQAKQSKNYANAIVSQRESELRLATTNYNRSKKLYNNKSIPLIELQKDEMTFQSAQAALLASKAQVISASASINAALAQVETIKVRIDESNLYSPIKGRILYKISQNGEIIGSGGRVLVALDLMNTYMTIFLPTSQAGLVNIGSDARIVLDALPKIAIPATVTFVSPQAQFTPKSIETQTEREKLMFRIKVKINTDLLAEHFDKIKTGLPGVAYVRLNSQTPWPQNLNNLPKSTQTNSVK
ncbi:MAG: efflux RND transporter periplasmic adaptor subunit [Arcobacteraceae bacterium]